MKESDIQNDIMNMLGDHPYVAWAHVTTSGTVKGRGGHWMKLGFTGLSDIIGQLKTGQLFAIEVKQKTTDPTKHQLEFIDLVNRNGGVAGVARSPIDAMDLIESRIEAARFGGGL